MNSPHPCADGIGTAHPSGQPPALAYHSRETPDSHIMVVSFQGPRRIPWFGLADLGFPLSIELAQIARFQQITNPDDAI
jgi:hypothetical protein